MKTLITGIIFTLSITGMAAGQSYQPPDDFSLRWNQRELVQQQQEQTRIMQEQLDLQRQQNTDRQREQRQDNPFFKVQDDFKKITGFKD